MKNNSFLILTNFHLCERVLNQMRKASDFLLIKLFKIKAVLMQN